MHSMRLGLSLITLLVAAPALSAATDPSLQPLYDLAGDKCFKEYPGNPVLKPEMGMIDAAAMGTMTVVRVNGLFHMYYEAWGAGDRVKSPEIYYPSLQIGHATSKDGIHWTKDAAPAIPKAADPKVLDLKGTWDPFVIYEDGKFKMWYGGGCDSPSVRVANPWHFAESDDGTHFTTIAHINPEQWTPHDEDDRVVHDRKTGKYYMYYLDRDPKHSGIFRVESPDETHFNFTKSVPIKIPGLPWGTFFKYPQTFQVGDTWYMFFGTTNDARNDAMGLASSPDGVNWTLRNPRVLRKGHDAALLKVADDLYVLYYGPNRMQDENKCDIRLAVFKGTLEDMLDPKSTGTMQDFKP